MFRFHYLPLFLLVIGLSLSYWLGYTPLLLSVIFIVFSVFSYLYYAKDKSAAKQGEWRVPESRLHLFSLLCGWPGSIIAQEKLRHKTKKVSFRLVFWLTVVVNITSITWLHSQQGSKMIKDGLVRLEHLTVAEFGNNIASSTILLFTHLRPKY